MINHEDTLANKGAESDKDRLSEESGTWSFYDLDGVNATDPELGAY